MLVRVFPELNAEQPKPMPEPADPTPVPDTPPQGPGGRSR